MTARRYQALTAAVAAWLAIIVAFALHLEIPYWSGITAWLVTSVDRKDVLQKGIGQVVATVIAAFVGYGLATTTEGSVALQLVTIVFVIAFGTWKRHTGAAPLAWIMSTLMVMVLLVESIISPASVGTVAIYRSYEMLTGVATATIVAFAFRFQYRRTARKEEARVAPPRSDRGIAFASLFAGFASIVILIVWDAFNIPSIVPVLISVIIVSGPDMKAMRALAWERVAGCIAGGGAGLLVVGLSIQSLWIWSLLLLAGLFVAGNFHHTSRPYAMAGTLAGIVFMLAVVGAGAPQNSLQLPIDVVVGITLASVLLALMLQLAEPWVRLHGKEPKRLRSADSS